MSWQQQADGSWQWGPVTVYQCVAGTCWHVLHNDCIGPDVHWLTAEEAKDAAEEMYSLRQISGDPNPQPLSVRERRALVAIAEKLEVAAKQLRALGKEP